MEILESGGEDRIIKRIQDEDAKYLILSDDYSLNWQNPMKIRAYIKENMKYTGNIGIFYIYENKPKSEIEEKEEENQTEKSNSEEEKEITQEENEESEE